MIKERWNKLNATRNVVLERARKCAKLTIPSLMPPEGATENTSLETPYQSVGARGVNNLASKLLITLLPPNRPFFRLQADETTLNQMEESQKDVRTAIEEKLAEFERIITSHISTKNLRVKTFEALKLLIVTGNTLIYQPDDGGAKVYRLNNYVCKRDPEGHVLEVIIKEEVASSVLPEDIRVQIKEEKVYQKENDETYELFTRFVRSEDGKRWEVTQECGGVDLPDSKGTYPIDRAPIMALRWSSLDGEDYGRGLVEEYLGDLLTLETLTKALTQGTTLAARVIYLVDPNSLTRPAKLEKAPNGAFIPGREQDITTLKLDKHMDFRFVYETINKLEARLEYAFLLMTSVQRDAERVTAEEVRRMAKELEDSLGGVYSVLSQEFQLPLVKRVMRQMELAGKLPELPEVEPTIVTGIEALGRGNDLQKLSTFIQGLLPLGEQNISMYLNTSTYITRLATALGIDTEGLVNSQEEVAQQLQAQQMQSMIGSSLPGVAQEAMKGAVQNE